MVIKRTVENVVQAKEQVDLLVAEGYGHDQIYIFAHDEKREKDITEGLDTEKVGLKEAGLMTSVKNLFSSRGDELRSEMQAAGLTKAEAETAESELDQGKLVIVVNS